MPFLGSSLYPSSYTQLGFYFLYFLGSCKLWMLRPLDLQKHISLVLAAS